MTTHRREFLSGAGALGAFGLAGAGALLFGKEPSQVPAGGEAPAKAVAEEGVEVSPIEDLMREHGVLKRVLLVYDEGLRRLDAKQEVPLKALNDGARIIRSFIEDYHGKLEEGYLFPRFKKANKLVDLVDVLMEQHRVGRQLTSVVLELSTGESLSWDNPAVPKDHPQIGFNLLRQKLGMDRLYYNFDHGGWHFVVLLNITLTKPGEYVSEYTDEQMAFLKQDLSQHKDRPTMIVGHFPAVTAIEFFGGNAKPQENGWTISFQRVARNPMALVEAVRGANVRATLSGHIHRLDHIEALGQTFICAGSVSGAKWLGNDHETPEGSGIFDCQPDSSFEYRYNGYGWDAAT